MPGNEKIPFYQQNVGHLQQAFLFSFDFSYFNECIRCFIKYLQGTNSPRLFMTFGSNCYSRINPAGAVLSTRDIQAANETGTFPGFVKHFLNSRSLLSLYKLCSNAGLPIRFKVIIHEFYLDNSKNNMEKCMLVCLLF